MNIDEIFSRLFNSHLIKEPRLLWDLLYLYSGSDNQTQRSIITRLLTICQESIHNPLILLTKTMQSTPDNTHLYILNLLVDLTLSSSTPDYIFDLISFLVYYCDIHKAHIDHLMQKLPLASESQLLLILRLLQLYMTSPKLPPPYSFFYFNAEGSGIIMNPVQYPFTKTLSMCLWIRLESPQTVARLFTFHCKGQGGLEAYIVEDCVYYRSLGNEYFLPVKGSNGILLCKLPVKTWTFLAFCHRAKEGLNRNHLRVVVNDNEVLSSMMDFPAVGGDETSTAGIGFDLFGQITCALFFNDVLTVEKMKSLYLHYNFGPHSSDSLASIDRFITGSLAKHLKFVFHPERTYKNYMYNAVSPQICKLIGLTGAKTLILRKNSSFGGILMLLPILSQIIQLQSNDLLIEWLRLVMFCLKDKPNNQLEALSSNFVKILAESLSELPNFMVTENAINLIDDLKNCGNNKLPEQVLVYLLWNLQLWTRSDKSAQLHLLCILKSTHAKNKQLFKLIGIDRILDNFKHLQHTDCIELYAELVEFCVLSCIEANYTENLVKFITRKVKIDVIIKLLEIFKHLIAAGGAFLKQIVEAKGLEVCVWLLSYKDARVKHLSIDVCESLMQQYKFTHGFTSDELLVYISSFFQIDGSQDVFSSAHEYLRSESDGFDPEQPRGRKSLQGASPRGRRSSYSTTSEKKDEQFYYISLELMLGRTLESSNILDDTDYIHSTLGLCILQNVVKKSSIEVRHKAIQDQLMLTKWNIMNCRILLENSDWHYWLLDLIFETFNNAEAADAIVDIAVRLHSTVIVQVFDREDALGFYRRMLTWYEVRERSPKARVILRRLFESLLQALGKAKNLNEMHWSNLLTLGYFLEDFIVYCMVDAVPIWEDATACQGYFILIRPVWDRATAVFEDFYRQIKEIQPLRYKAEAGWMNFEPEGELKKRGRFGLVLFHLVSVAISKVEDMYLLEFWLGAIEGLVKTVLFISESHKKTLSKQESLFYSHCIIYAVGYLCQEIQKHAAKMVILLALARLLKYIFLSYSLHSAKSKKSVFKNLLKLNLNKYNYPCDFLINLISQSGNNVDNWISIISNYNIREVQSLLSQTEVQHALFYAYSQVHHHFSSTEKADSLIYERQKSSEKYLGECRANAAIDEQNNLKIADYIKETLLALSAEENSKARQREVEKEFKSYERRRVIQKIIRSCNKRSADDKELRLQKTMCKDFSRPFMTVKSQKKKFTARQKQGKEGSVVPSISFSQIRRSSFKADEEEVEVIEDLKLRITEESAKVTDGFSALVGLITPEMIKYGCIQIKGSKKQGKLAFRYDAAVEEKYSTGIELFRFSPGFQVYAKTWRLADLINVFPKSYLMRPTALELIFSDGKSALLNFCSYADRMDFLLNLKKRKKSLMNLKISKPKVVIKSIPLTSYKVKIIVDAGMTEKWLNWQISNFEYLMYLNFCAGRSYSDLTQYPVMPWVTAEFDQAVGADGLRDLSKNMGSLGSPERIAIFEDRFRNMPSDGSDPPFHFGSHYSNPAIALFYLIRVSPFDECAKELQGGKFDLPDRLFYSISESYASAIDDIADVRELIPEFFFLPEMLRNVNQLPFGKTQGGETISDVKLPRWSKTADDFIRIHRELLEAEPISSNINRWIDLIFGFKQQGVEAEKALNVFYYLTYENNVDTDKITDPVLQKTINTQIYHFGRTPSQLFTKPHPQRKPLNKVLDLPNLFCNTPTLKIYFSALSKIKSSPTALSTRSIVKIKALKDKELHCIRLNRSITKFSFTRSTGENNVYFSCDPIQTIDYTPESLIEAEDPSLNYKSCPYVLFNNCKCVVLGGFWDGKIQVKRVLSAETINLKFVHHSTVTCVEVGEDEKCAVTGSRDGECVVWTIDAEIWSFRATLVNHEDEITAISIAEDFHIFLTAGLDGRCNIYSAETLKLVNQIVIPGNRPILFAKISAAVPCKAILYSMEDRVIYSYSVNGGLLNVIQESFNVSSLIVCRYLTCEDFLIYAGEKGDIVFRHAGSFDKLHTTNLGVASPIASLAVTCDYKHLLIGCVDGELAIMTQ